MCETHLVTLTEIWTDGVFMCSAGQTAETTLTSINSSMLLNVSGLHWNCDSFSGVTDHLEHFTTQTNACPCMQTHIPFTQWWNSCPEQFAVQYLDQGRFDMETAGAPDGIIDLPTRGRPLFLLSRSCSTAS